MAKGLLTILVADDDDLLRSMNAEFAKRAFPEYDSRVIEVADGEELYQAAKREKVDVAVTDINMPFMTGPKAIKKLRDEGIKFKVLAVTGDSRDNNLTEVKELELTCLEKPYSPKDYLNALRRTWPEYAPQEAVVS